MKPNHLEQKALIDNYHCHGAVSRKIVRERAAELAGTAGRSCHEVSKADWEQAKWELSGHSGPTPAHVSAAHQLPSPSRSTWPREHNHQIRIMNKNHSVVAIYASHTAAEVAVKELQQAGFDMRKLSIVGRDSHTDERVIGYYNTGDRMKAWGKLGAFWGGLWGMLFGSAFFLVPGVGPLLVAGPLVSWIVGAMEGAAVLGGLSALGAGLFSLGIPKDSILQYETALKTDKFVLIAHGSLEETFRAREILQPTDPERLDHHHTEQS